MKSITQSIPFRSLTWLVLLTFAQTLTPHPVWARSPWMNQKKNIEDRRQNTEDRIQNSDPVGAGSSRPELEKQFDPPVAGSARPQEPPSDLLAANTTLDTQLQASDVPPVPVAKNRKGEAQLAPTRNTPLPLAAVLDVYSSSLSGSELREISNSFRREVKNTGRFLVYNKAEMKKALAKNLDQEIAAAKQIDEYVGQAKSLYEGLKFDSAAAIMKEAMKAISAFDATPAVARKISEAYLIQGLILVAQEKEKEADAAFLNAAALDPDRQLDPTIYPPDAIAKFYKAKGEYSKIKEGSLRVETTPPVAKVVLGDHELGSSPATLKNLPLGIQKVIVMKDGFEPWEKNVMIVATGEKEYINKVEIDLNKTGESVSLDALVGEVVSRKDIDSQISKIADVGKLLLADQVFAARIEKGEGGYDLFLSEIEVGSASQIARAYSLIDPNLADVDISMAHALQDMLAGKAAAKTPDLIAVEGKDSHYTASYKKSKPFYKRWPFFVLIGLAVAGGGAGAALALTSGGGGGGTPTGTATIGGTPQP